MAISLACALMTVLLTTYVTEKRSNFSWVGFSDGLYVSNFTWSSRPFVFLNLPNVYLKKTRRTWAEEYSSPFPDVQVRFGANVTDTINAQVVVIAPFTRNHLFSYICLHVKHTLWATYFISQHNTERKKCLALMFFSYTRMVFRMCGPINGY